MDIQTEQRDFRQSKPSRLGRGIERLTHTFGQALASIVPKGLVEAVLNGLDRSVAGPQLITFDHDTDDLEAAQAAAGKVDRAARGISASSGMAAGLGGALSMGADIPQR